MTLRFGNPPLLFARRGLYTPGKGDAGSRLSMAANSRRFRCPSASSSQ